MKNNVFFNLLLMLILIGCSNPKIKKININCISIHIDSNYKTKRNYLMIRVKSNIDLKKHLDTDKFQCIMFYAAIADNDSFFYWRRNDNPEKFNNIKYFDFNLSNNNILETVLDSNAYIYETHLFFMKGYSILPVDSAIVNLEHYFLNNKVLTFQGYWTPYFLQGLYKATYMKEFVVEKQMLKIN